MTLHVFPVALWSPGWWENQSLWIRAPHERATPKGFGQLKVVECHGHSNVARDDEFSEVVPGVVRTQLKELGQEHFAGSSNAIRQGAVNGNIGVRAEEASQSRTDGGLSLSTQRRRLFWRSNAVGNQPPKGDLLCGCPIVELVCQPRAVGCTLRKTWPNGIDEKGHQELIEQLANRVLKPRFKRQDSGAGANRIQVVVVKDSLRKRPMHAVLEPCRERRVLPLPLDFVKAVKALAIGEVFGVPLIGCEVFAEGLRSARKGGVDKLRFPGEVKKGMGFLAVEPNPAKVVLAAQGKAHPGVTPVLPPRDCAGDPVVCNPNAHEILRVFINVVIARLFPSGIVVRPVVSVDDNDTRVFS
eukprot:m.123218 g.123218  ORF g.123218 m.123218 type:complete len:356 (+) comp13451_c0_seq3:254-1321(+)